MIKRCVRYFSVCSLKSRGIVSLKGKDAKNLLQGLLSNDMFQLNVSGNHSRLMYTGLFNSKGRVEMDLFVHEINDTDDEILIDCCIKNQLKLVEVLKKYRLRMKLDIDIEPEKAVYAVLPPVSDQGMFSLNSEQTQFNKLRAYFDPRMPGMGFRYIDKVNNPETIIVDSPYFPKDVDDYNYKKLRCIHGICENSEEIPSGEAIPLEYNFDIFNGGCYLGQELSARTKYRGQIRKRLLPVKLSESLNFPEMKYPLIIVSHDSSKVGELKVSAGFDGVALARLQYLNQRDQIYRYFLKDYPHVTVDLVKPTWFDRLAIHR